MKHNDSFQAILDDMREKYSKFDSFESVTKALSDNDSSFMQKRNSIYSLEDDIRQKDSYFDTHDLKKYIQRIDSIRHKQEGLVATVEELDRFDSVAKDVVAMVKQFDEKTVESLCAFWTDDERKKAIEIIQSKISEDNGQNAKRRRSE